MSLLKSFIVKGSNNCLTDSGRGFNKQLLLMINCLIYIGNKLLLPLPIGKGKGQSFNGFLTCILPFKLKIRPFTIL